MDVLFLTDKPDAYFSLKRTLSQDRFNAILFLKRHNFYSLIRKKEIRIVILESTIEEISDFALLKAIKNYDPLIEVILIGPSITEEKIIEAIEAGAMDYLPQPVNAKMLNPILDRIKHKTQTRRETLRLEKKLVEKYLFQGMVGRSPSMLEVFSLIERVAKHSVPVLITGETGTGKEMVAQAIHNLSPRCNRKIVICDSTSIPETLFESELFGYLKGAFTGADKSKNGLFKEADGGTIFLDEIAEIPVSVQSKLLRVLEEHQFRPLGSNQNEKVDVRVISATSRDLRELIKKERFREDLFHRINIVEIKLPSLRERKGDIPLLFSYFLDKFNRKFGKKELGISQRAKKVLLSYFWPGNVRQLEHVMERSVMLCQESFLDIKDLPDFLKELAEEDKGDMQELYPFSALSLEEVEKRHILEILRRAKNNKRKAAKMLGLNRQALYRKLKKHGIPF